MSLTPSGSRSSGLTSSRRYEWLVESKGKPIELSAEEQSLLEATGRQLARGTGRFGEEIPASEASVLQCTRVDAAHCLVRVADAVGVIALPTLQLEVRPKIPQNHLLYLLGRASYLPRLGTNEAHLGEASSLFELIAHWFLVGLERLLKQGLARGYRPETAELTVPRGRISPLPTGRLFYRGRLSVVADYEEFDFDTALNRTLLYAARLLLSNTDLPGRLRRRARRVAARMDGVGEWHAADRHAAIERRTANYADPILLAKTVIDNVGRHLLEGQGKVWTFLIRTPEAVEEGLRAGLRDYLPSSLRKRSLAVPGGITLNPDLVFGEGAAIGDVKYKLGGAEWNRSDLYEVVAFAAGFCCERAVILNFRRGSDEGLPAVRLGDIEVTELAWHVATGWSPEASLARLAADLGNWLARDQLAPAA